MPLNFTLEGFFFFFLTNTTAVHSVEVRLCVQEPQLLREGIQKNNPTDSLFPGMAGFGLKCSLRGEDSKLCTYI